MHHTDLADLVILKSSSRHAAGSDAMADASSSSSNPTAADKCPVDHKTREVWLEQARAAQQQQQQGRPMVEPSRPAVSAAAAAAATPSTSWTRSLASYIPFWSSGRSSSTTAAASASTAPPKLRPAPTSPADLLPADREVSSIPRTAAAQGPGADSAAGGAAAAPTSTSNHEVETGADPATGNWVYPSQRMFFEAMRRKGATEGDGGGVRAADMAAVVPIHNAVNERAWREIKEWERPYAAPNGSCPGPALHSFAGLSSRMTPRARLYTLLGYTAPFDRHDWVVDRCGTRVEYVIDFYAGRGSSAGGDEQGGGKLSFYLDVRPKLNTWEGVRMRAWRALGIV